MICQMTGYSVRVMINTSYYIGTFDAVDVSLLYTGSRTTGTTK